MTNSNSSGDYCLYRCGKKKGFTDRNYAGFNVKEKGKYSFPHRIRDLILPGDPKTQFLCSACANKIKVECKVHGPIKGFFTRRKSPTCKKCDEELKSLNKGILPDGFLWLLPVTSIQLKYGKAVNRGFLAASNDMELFVIRNKNLSTTNVLFISNEIIEKNGLPVLSINLPSLNEVLSCHVRFEDPSILDRASGPWHVKWVQKISYILKIEPTFESFWLVSIQSQTVLEGQLFPSDPSVSPVVICVPHKNKLLTIPNLNLPSLDNIRYWRTSRNESPENLELAFSVEGIPYIVRLRHLYVSGNSNPIEELTTSFPVGLRNKKPEVYDLSLKGIFNGILNPKGIKERFLVEVKGKTLFATPLPSGQSIRFSKGFSYKNTYLLISENNDILAVETTNKNIKTIFEKADITEPEKFFEKEHYNWSVFLYKENPSLGHTLRINRNNFTIDDESPISFSKIRGDIQVIDLSRGLCEIVIDWEESNKTRSLHLIAPESLAYDTVRKMEVFRTEYGFDSMNIPTLYQRYGELKTINLLFVLFSDIIILNQDLNSGRSMRDLADELECLDDNQFHKNKDLKKDALQKLLLLALNLPKIKRRIEYLANYYPYFMVDNEKRLVTDAFGNNMAKKVMPGEDKIVRDNARKTVRLLQANLQRVISEIEKAVSPIESLFDRNNARKEWMSRLRRNVSHAGQIALTVALVASGGTFALLAGMLGIRSLGEVATLFEKDRQATNLTKRATAIVLPWWKLFTDTLIVNIKETSELLCEENLRCMERDRKIYDKLPTGLKLESQSNLVKALQRRIVEETNNRFVEVMEGSGIRFETIASDIQLLNEFNIHEKIHESIGDLYRDGARLLLDDVVDINGKSENSIRNLSGLNNNSRSIEDG